MLDEVTHITRSERIDIAKGLLMAIVILGHAIQFIGYRGRADFWSDPVFNAIYMFHMPLFMAYSGFFSPLRSVTIGDVARRVQSLIYPMLPWSIIVALLRAAANGDWQEVPGAAWHGFWGNYWFLWCAFLSLLIMWAGQALGAMGLFLYAGVMAALMLAPVIWGVLPMLAFVFLFFLAGHLVRRHGETLTRFFPALVGVAAVVTVFAFLSWNELTYIYNNHARIAQYPEEVMLMFVGAASATCVAIWGGMRLGRALEGTQLGRLTSRLGRMTLEVYLVQGVIFAASGVFAPLIPGSASEFALGRWFASFVTALALTVAIFVFVELTKRSSVLSKLLWGR